MFLRLYLWTGSSFGLCNVVNPSSSHFGEIITLRAIGLICVEGSTEIISLLCTFAECPSDLILSILKIQSKLLLLFCVDLVNDGIRSRWKQRHCHPLFLLC